MWVLFTFLAGKVFYGFRFLKHKKSFVSWNVKSFFFGVSVFRNMRTAKYKNFIWGFRFLKYKKFSQEGFFFIFRAWAEKYRVPLAEILEKLSFKKIWGFFNIRARKFHFPKYKEFFSGWICWFFELGLKSAPDSPIIYYKKNQVLSES